MPKNAGISAICGFTDWFHVKIVLAESCLGNGRLTDRAGPSWFDGFTGSIFVRAVGSLGPIPVKEPR